VEVKIILEEHFLPRELDEYFHTPVKKGVSSESFDKAHRITIIRYTAIRLTLLFEMC
jgi:hypothetical protein